MRLSASVALAACLVFGVPDARAEPVDLELVLAADGSGSIDDAEMRLQRDGYADAIVDPAVLASIGAGFLGRIAIAYSEWGGADSQHLIVDWHVVDGPASAAEFAAKLRAAPRQAEGWNSISNAIVFATGLIGHNEHEGSRKVIDVSADSGQYGGVPLPLARQQAVDAGITINGLAILCRSCNGRPSGGDLEGHFERDIIGGDGAFVVTADAATSFRDAVHRKLLLEIAGRETRPVLADGR